MIDQDEIDVFEREIKDLRRRLYSAEERLKWMTEDLAREREERIRYQNLFYKPLRSVDDTIPF